MQRFYFPLLESGDESLTIQNKELLNQFIKVLRVKLGDQVVFFNGNDTIDFVFEIKDIAKKDIYLEKIEEKENNSEIDFDLNIFQALPNKLDKIEHIIAKGTEVGISGFYFFRSERSQKLHISDNKRERLEKIIIEATEQSGRSRVPELIIEDNLCLEDIKEHENIFFHTQGDNSVSLSELDIEKQKGINLFVGPEGGWSNDEIKTFMDLKFQKVHLGNRILRAETVGVVCGFYITQ